MLKAIKNSILLIFSQIGAYIIPLVELPILTRSLSPEILGSIFFIQGLILTFSIVVEYGFNYNATGQVAKKSKSTRAIRLIFTKVYSAKLILFIFSILAISIYFTLSNHNIPKIWLVFALLQFIGFAFSPYWYFQGMQELKGVVSCDLIIRFIYLSLIVFLVKSDEDALLVVALQGCASLLVTLVTSYIAMQRVKNFNLSLLKGVEEIKSGFGYFLFKGGSTLLLSLNAIIVGQVMSFTALAIFVSAEKVIKAGAGIFNPIMNAFYPYFCTTKSKENKIKFIVLSSFLSVVSTVVLYFLSPYLVYEILKFDEKVLSVLEVFIFVIPVKVFIQSILVSLLLPDGRIQTVSKVTVISSIGLIVLSLVSSMFFNLIVLIKLIIMVDIFILCFYLVYIKRNKLC